MTDLHFGPTGKFEALTDEAAGRFDRRVLKKIEASEVMLERIRVDPFLRDAHIVLKAATDVDARKAAKRLRGRWFPFHALNDDNQKRVAWFKDLQESTVADAREHNLPGERTKRLLEQQAMWLAVLRCPMTLTDDLAWKEARKSWTAELKEEPLPHSDSTPGMVHKPQTTRPSVQTLSHERFLAEARLLAMESLHTAYLCETVDTKLTDAQKAVLRYFYVIGLMENQIGNQMGLMTDAVGQLRRRALGAVRKEAVG
jgi:hypothetical protein